MDECDKCGYPQTAHGEPGTWGSTQTNWGCPEPLNEYERLMRAFYTLYAVEIDGKLHAMMGGNPTSREFREGLAISAVVELYGADRAEQMVADHYQGVRNDYPA